MTYNKRELFYKSQGNGKAGKQKPEVKEKVLEKELSIGESEVRALLATRKGANANTLYFALQNVGNEGKQSLFLLSSKDSRVTIPQSTICEVIAAKYGIDRKDAGVKVQLLYDVQRNGIIFRKATVLAPLAPNHPTDDLNYARPTKIIKTKYTPG